MDILVTVIISLSLTTFIFFFVDILVNFKFVHWWLKNRMWKKKQYSVVFDYDGRIGLEVTDGIAITGLVGSDYETKDESMLIVRIPEEGAANHSMHSYWLGRGFHAKFSMSTLAHPSIKMLTIAPRMYDHLCSLYKQDIIDLEDMQRL